MIYAEVRQQSYSRAIDLAISWLVQTDLMKSFSIFPASLYKGDERRYYA
jgi:hypothetical protein